MSEEGRREAKKRSLREEGETRGARDNWRKGKGRKGEGRGGEEKELVESEEGDGERRRETEREKREKTVLGQKDWKGKD